MWAPVLSIQLPLLCSTWGSSTCSRGWYTWEWNSAHITHQCFPRIPVEETQIHTNKDLVILRMSLKALHLPGDFNTHMFHGGLVEEGYHRASPKLGKYGYMFGGHQACTLSHTVCVKKFLQNIILYKLRLPNGRETIRHQSKKNPDKHCPWEK